MRSTVIVLVASCRLLAACAATSNDPASASETTSSSTDASSTDESTSASTPDLDTVCAMQSSRETCEAVPSAQNKPVGTVEYCYWESWRVTSLVEGMCVFGAPVSPTCKVGSTTGEGCANPPAICGDVQTPWTRWRTTATGTIELAMSDSCIPTEDTCVIAESGEPSPPECACVCDPAYE